MNYMKDVAALLGVEIGEEFELIDDKGVQKDHGLQLTDTGLVYSNGCSVDSYLPVLLNGEYTIKKKPQMPKNGDTYYVIRIGEWGVSSLCWNNYSGDKLYLLAGNVFKTKEEAESHIEEFKKRWEETLEKYR